MCEQLLELKPLYRFHSIFDRAEELYTPSGPPMSPLTQSYYNGWMMFDVSVWATARESLGSIALAVYKRFGAHEHFLKLASNMIGSRGGLYLVEKVYDAGLLDLIELGSVFYSYVNHTENFIYSKGLPDLAESLPHMDEYQHGVVF